MSEDSRFNRNKKEEERCSVPDFCGPFVKGMLAIENIETPGNSSGMASFTKKGGMI